MRWLLLLIVCLSFLSVWSQSTADTSYGAAPIEILPESEINIPIQIALKPLYALAERNVDTVFTSPHYPDGWVQADCATRYKYYFRRSPLRLQAIGATFQLQFTGFYKIIGSTRACVGGTVLSPWTPECKCGFSEGERKVDIGFTSSFVLQPNHLLHLQIARTEPRPLNKCTVCFWGQDITAAVMTGLKAELDLSTKAIMDSVGTINLKPYLQQAWNKLSEVYALPELGYLSLNPKKLRMENIKAQNDFLNINLGITASPAVTFIKPHIISQPVPELTTGNGRNNFNLHLEAALQYDSLSKVVNGYLEGKRFDLSDGLIKNHVIIKSCKVYSLPSNQMAIEVAFGGSFDGTVYFTGKPVYNAATQMIELQQFDYDLKTRSWLLKTAKWLFDKRIVAEIRKYTAIDLSGYYDTAALTMNTWLNKEWTKGIRGNGKVEAIKLTGVYAQPEHLLVRSQCSGNLSVVVSEIQMNF